MAETQRIGHPYPNKNDRDWFNAFMMFAESLDAADFAARSDRSLVVFWEGNIEYIAAGTIRWLSPIVVIDGLTGFIGTIAPNPTGLSIQDGQIAYVNVARPPTKSYDLQLVVSNRVPPNNESVPIFLRRSTRLFIRGYGILNEGEDTSKATGGGGGGTGSGFEAGEILTNDLLLATRAFQGDGEIVIGRHRFDADDYSYANAATRTISFKAEANLLTQTGSLQAFLRLVDVTAVPTNLASFTVTADQPTLFQQAFVPSSGVRIYEVRAGMDPAGSPYNPGEEIAVWRAAIQIQNTF